MHHGVGLGLGGASHRACHGGSVAAESELIFHQLFLARSIHHDEYEICFSGADLETEAAAFYDDSLGGAPATSGSACQNAFTVLGSDDKACAFQAWNDADTLSLFEDVLGDAFIGSIHNFVENGGRFVNAL